MLNFSIIHTLIFAIYPILLLYASNIDKVDPVNLMLPISISLVATSLLACVFYLIFKNFPKTTLATSAVLTYFYAYGYVLGIFQIACERLSYNMTIAIPVVWTILLIMAITGIWTRRKVSLNFIRFLNILALTLLTLTLFDIASYIIKKPADKYSEGFEAVKTRGEKHKKESLKQPDIYYIILDGYARSDVLKKLYNFKKSSFIDFLKSQGFYVADKARANYCQTYLSLSSSLNFTYLDKIAKRQKNSNSVEPLIKVVSNNRLFHFLEKKGYNTVSMASGYSGTNMKNAQYHFGVNILDTEFFIALLDTTLLSRIRSSFFEISEMNIDSHIKRITKAFARLATVKDKVNSPFIVFSHIIAPHPPFVFDAQGNRVPETTKFSLDDGSHWRKSKDIYRKRYLEQLKFVNAQVKELVKKLLKKEGEKIIIIQSDHGPGSQLDWNDPEKTNMKERLGCLYSIYFSDGDYKNFAPEMTPVNTFRIILNKYFNTDYKILENRSYFSSWNNRYKLIDVTDRIIDES
ncbi:MAG: sulfatase-like hydrolase/transferase [Candidatus Rifleibacteriota bacterium]